MIGDGPLRSSDHPRWHRLIEHYTPDGALGRVLLASGAGALCTFGIWLAAIGFVSRGLVAALLSFAGAGLALSAGFLAVVVLWPVYLSLIDNVDSAEEYLQSGDATARTSESDDSLDLLKRQYAAGKLSDEEFEQRLDVLLDVEQRVDRDQTPTSHREDDVSTALADEPNR